MSSSWSTVRYIVVLGGSSSVREPIADEPPMAAVVRRGERWVLETGRQETGAPYALVDMAGRTLMRGECGEGGVIVESGGLAPGVYIMRIGHRSVRFLLLP